MRDVNRKTRGWDEGNDLYCSMEQNRKSLGDYAEAFRKKAGSVLYSDVSIFKPITETIKVKIKNRRQKEAGS